MGVGWGALAGPESGLPASTFPTAESSVGLDFLLGPCQADSTSDHSLAHLPQLPLHLVPVLPLLSPTLSRGLPGFLLHSKPLCARLARPCLLRPRASPLP